MPRARSLVGSLPILAAAIWPLATIASGAQTPEFFGLYADVGGGLKELRMFDASGVAPKTEAEAKAAVERMLQACAPLNGSLRLVLYDDHMAPSRVGVVSMTSNQNLLVEWRVAPLGTKPGMYRLAPRVEPPPGAYRVFADPNAPTAQAVAVGDGFGAKYSGCILLNITAVEYLQTISEGGGAPAASAPAAAPSATASGSESSRRTNSPTGSPAAASAAPHAAPAVTSTAPLAKPEPKTVTKTVFSRLTKDMPWAKVVELLGEPSNCSENRGNTTCLWTNADGSAAVVRTYGGKVTSLQAIRLPD